MGAVEEKFSFLFFLSKSKSSKIRIYCLNTPDGYHVVLVRHLKISRSRGANPGGRSTVKPDQGKAKP